MNLRKHIFVEGSQRGDMCVKNIRSGLISPCGKRRSDEIHIEKKIIKNIHPPKSPAKRSKLGSIRLKKLQRKARYKMAKVSRKKNRARSE